MNKTALLCLLLSVFSLSYAAPGLSVYFGLTEFQQWQGVIYAQLPKTFTLGDVVIPPLLNGTIHESKLSNVHIENWRFKVAFPDLGKDNETLTLNINKFQANISAKFDLGGIINFEGWMNINETTISLVIGTELVNGSYLPHIKNLSIQLSDNSLSFSIPTVPSLLSLVRQALQSELPPLLVSVLNQKLNTVHSISIGNTTKLDLSFAQKPSIFNNGKVWILPLLFNAKFSTTSGQQCPYTPAPTPFQDSEMVFLGLHPTDAFLNCLFQVLARENVSLSTSSSIFKLGITQWLANVKLEQEKESRIELKPDGMNLSLHLQVDFYTGANSSSSLPILQLHSLLNAASNFSVSGTISAVVVEGTVFNASVDPNSFFAEYNGSNEKWRKSVTSSNFKLLATKLNAVIQPLLVGTHQKHYVISPFPFFKFKTVQQLGSFYFALEQS